MPVQIKNTSTDRMKAQQHRTRHGRFEYEPTIGSQRIRIGQTITISDEHYLQIKPLVDQWEKNGMVTVSGVIQPPIEGDTGEPKSPEKGHNRDGKEDREQSKSETPKNPAPPDQEPHAEPNSASMDPNAHPPAASDSSESPRKGFGRKKLI